MSRNNHDVTYEIVRFHSKGDKVVMRQGLTLEEAQEHCTDPETNSKTAKGREAREWTREHGEPWFDGYREE